MSKAKNNSVTELSRIAQRAVASEPTSTPAGLTVFISYSHTDEAMRAELVKHLDPLRRIGWLNTWHDQKIQPGDCWEHELSKHLEISEIFLLLISIDFINSRYCYDVEMSAALQRHSRGSARVIPIILRSCLWQHTPFGKLQALPKDGRAISAWSDRDEAFTNVVENIGKIVQAMRENKPLHH